MKISPSFLALSEEIISLESSKIGRLMEIDRLIVGPLRTNCYILSEGRDCIVIDPGGDHDIIIEHLQKKNLTPTKILATHGHFDHILSVSAIKLKFDIPFFVSKKDEPIIEGFRKFVKTYFGMDPGDPPVPDKDINNEDIFRIGSKSLKAIENPGHTPGSHSFMVDNAMFSGDFVFNGSIGRTDFGGSYSEMSNSIRSLKKLEGDVNIYPGHGEFTTLEDEKNNNPFFKEIF